MPRSFTDEAIVLRVYNVGETDRFCLLLTRKHGRMTARASGVRRTTSRRGQGLLPLHRVTVLWEERSMGNFVTSTHCLNAHASAWRDPHAFSCAGQGIELLLKLTEDGMQMTDVYDLTAEFLCACDGSHSAAVASLYTLKLLKVLGYLPASITTPRTLSSELHQLLDASEETAFASSYLFSDHLARELSSFLSSLIGNQLGVSLKASSVCLAIPPGVTPSCQ